MLSGGGEELFIKAWKKEERTDGTCCYFLPLSFKHSCLHISLLLYPQRLVLFPLCLAFSYSLQLSVNVLHNLTGQESLPPTYHTSPVIRDLKTICWYTALLHYFRRFNVAIRRYFIKCRAVASDICWLNDIC